MLTPTSRPKVLTDLPSPLALTTWEQALRQDSDLNNSLQQLLATQGQDLTQALLYLRNRDLKQAEDVTRRKMRRMGRCPVCTLQLPCKHYQHRDSLPREQERIVDIPKEPIILNIAQSGQSDLPTPTFTTRFTPSPRKTDLTPVRFRSPEGVSYRRQPKDRSKSELKRTEERRLRLLEKLDRYREQRLRREIERLEELKRRENEERQEELSREQKRNMRQAALKQQLADYHEKMRKEQEVYQKQLAQQVQRLRLERNKRSFPLDRLPQPTVTKVTTLDVLRQPSESGDLETIAEVTSQSQAS